jgi:hypothetical protein
LQDVPIVPLLKGAHIGIGMVGQVMRDELKRLVDEQAALLGDGGGLQCAAVAALVMRCQETPRTIGEPAAPNPQPASRIPSR